MAHQPAAGTRDRHPGEVETQRQLCDQLAALYRLWGYREVAPPGVERLDTLLAGGGVEDTEVVRLAQAVPLGLRPEFTASIARAAGSRFAARPRPLRLWASGVTFRQQGGDGESGHGPRIQEQMQSGVELLGERAASADCELLHLLIAAAGRLGLRPEHRPQLLVGHHGLLAALLEPVPEPMRPQARRALTQLDPLSLAALPLAAEVSEPLLALIRLRGTPDAVIAGMRGGLGAGPALEALEALEAILQGVGGAAAEAGIRLQLDPTFQPHYSLYDGLVFQLVCHGGDTPVVIASGGRYDGLVGRFCGPDTPPAGLGFAVAIEAISELLGGEPMGPVNGPWLVVPAVGVETGAALARMAQLHAGGEAAELGTTPCASAAEADALAASRGCRGAIWIPA
ncbi:MAG: ATP phosphoribosyltransferase regulatory subunit [Cyanobacteriota bacterium]|nr:ATP phosphoribosyltransferase regulatory subunit [Cyanobacteriota bacterium]